MGERRGTKGLELWCRKMTEGHAGVKIDNMTTSWRDGLAFCAIIHHFRPDLIEFDKLNKDDIYHNNELAFRVAEHHLGIPALLEPEDMVEYEVPDRLSILTYLSQFYQTFENQRGKSSARIAPKRPLTTPDHGIVSPASTSPPTKVQITIGRTKREPCAKCGLPVFIAERLNVGKLLYHRTCFRCARCNSQLTLANYYETENSEFCCEICPDEEKIISKKRSSEHSVLMRSMSDEEKSANLQTYSEGPDAYSTHFETALEYPVDGELKRNFTLTDAESTEFGKARSHFFKSQIEDSSDSGSEDIPPDLPQSKPPPISKINSGHIKTDNELVPRDSSFSSDKKDTNVVSDSVSEQTNDHFVTKDNASSPSGLSVRARMKLFENNKDKKSDVNSFSSSKQVPFDSMQKKKATVVAIDDLEDFDNISKKDITIDTPLDRSSNDKAHSDYVRNDGTVESDNDNLNIFNDSNVEFNQNINHTNSMQLKIKSSNLDVETKTQESDIPVATHEIDIAPKEIPEVIELLDSSQEQDTSGMTIDKEEIIEIIDSDEQKSYITIDNSPVAPNDNMKASIVSVSDESVISVDSIVPPQTNSSHDGEFAKPELSLTENNSMSIVNNDISPLSDVISPQTNLSPDSVAAKRGYYTANDVLSPPENNKISVINDDVFPTADVVSPQTNFSDDSVVAKSEYYTAYEVLSPTENNNISLLNDDISPPSHPSPDIVVAKRGYYTANEVLSPPENKSISVINDDISLTADILSPQTNSPDDSIVAKRGYYTAYEVLSPPVDISLDNQDKKDVDLDDIVHETDLEHAENISLFSSDEQQIKPPIAEKKNDIIVPLNEVPPQPNDNIALRRDETVVSPRRRKHKPRKTESQTNIDNSEPPNGSDVNYPEVLNPFDDDTEETSAVSSSLNPFGEPDDEEIISKPISSVRPKKKIIPSLEEREIKGTPEAFSRIYTERISFNPFEADEDEEEKVQEFVSQKPTPSPRQKKKLFIPVNISLNPFDSDEDNDKIVPVPAPRITKTSPARPEPRPRDNLSITSRGSHGGSNSSISSGSAVGSARKKKPAPRPPVPFRNSEHLAPDCLTISPIPSGEPSPNLSGTIRSRKNKRAPLPPSASTPCPDKMNVGDRLPPNETSPESFESRDILPLHSEKNVKDEENRNRQSLNDTDDDPSPNESDTNHPMLNKSTSGRWKRRKGQAPSRPIPQRRTTKSLPMSEIKRELDTIEIQQQGLEKQGVRLEQIIREKCEGDEGINADDQVPIEVEDLILQLFELVNEKNELFRRQAELMYLRRQQRLEEEHADVEYQIRCLMSQPEANKTDSDKTREEALINRLVEIVERRNEIIECLEMDRVREAEEDNSISSQLNLYSLKRDGEKDQPKEEKKEKKKKHKKLTKIIHTLHRHKEKEQAHKVDVDKDIDETEVNLSAEKKKKKKFNLF